MARTPGSSRNGADTPKLLAHPLREGEREPLSRALAKAGMPVDDIDAAGRLFWRFETEDQLPVGYGGLEVHGKSALMRSVLTLPPLRHRGVGGAIVAALETEALVAGCHDVWLLADAAAPFFEHLDYRPRSRSEIPQAIATSVPDDAALLAKQLR